MLFNSLDFAIFLPVVFTLYWLLRRAERLRWQNLLLVVASYVFYGWWDWRFLTLIFLSTLVDYGVGIALAKATAARRRKALLTLSLVFNLGLLGVFKYFNFFIESASRAFSVFGADLDMRALHIVLPVGISFYTFQTLSYSIDVYRGRICPTRDFVAFSAFVAFFPQLVAGPIERASRLLPQFFEPRAFRREDAEDGVSQIVWGLFKKVVIADNCALYVDRVFGDPAAHPGSTLLLGALLFAFQIYGDFSGYSDIAIGTARLFGFTLMTNFAFPYFSRDIAEFWRRWHISLSSWFRDYVYIPLGGSRGGPWRKARNVFVVFAVSGLWHGANWTFVVWGLLNALYFLPLLLCGRHRENLEIVAHDRLLPRPGELCFMALTFGLTLVAWVFFRSASVSSAMMYLSGMFSGSLFAKPDIHPKVLLVLIAAFVAVEWIGRKGPYATWWVGRMRSAAARNSILYAILMATLAFMACDEQEFIYFQF